MKRPVWISILMLMLVLVSAACAGRSENTAQDSGAFPGMPPVVEGDKADGSFGGEVAAEEAPAAPSQPERGVLPQSVDRMVIRNADVAIIVDDPNGVLEAISDMANGMGGFVVSSNVYQRQNSQGLVLPEGTITVRVPSERLDEALDRIVALTTNPDEDVLRNNISGQDVTQEYTDLQSRLRNLEDAEAQLRQIMEDANRTEDVLNVFNQLTQIREQIEVIKGQIQYYEQSSDLSAITVSIQARAMIAPITIAGWTPAGVARDAVQALVEAGQFIATAAIWLVMFMLPVAAVIALPVALVVFLLRKYGRRRPPKITPTPAGE